MFVCHNVNFYTLGKFCGHFTHSCGPLSPSQTVNLIRALLFILLLLFWLAFDSASLHSASQKVAATIAPIVSM